jgi:hypothetical protein
MIRLQTGWTWSTYLAEMVRQRRERHHQRHSLRLMGVAYHIIITMRIIGRRMQAGA